MKKYFVFSLFLLILLSCYSCDPGGATMPDGSIQYRQLNISNKKELEFRDDDNIILLDEKDVAWVYEKYSEDDGYHLILEFTVDGTVELAEATKEHIGKELSLFVDDEKVFSLTVVTEITDGKISIIGKTSNYKQLMSLSEKIAG